ncbi:MAG: matrixin family metalloprotease [Labilithrix sp.]|nr:matrixin family metalloprotease [Labilithrix sp.]
MEDAIVIAAEVQPGTGVLADEPITTATLRGAIDGRDRVVRIVGGPTPHGGFARLAGYVVPTVGARVRLDLRDPRRVTSGTPSAPAGSRWTPSTPAGPRWTPSAPAGPRWTPSTPAGTWDTNALPVRFVLALPPSRDLGAEAAAELDVAARTWARPACTAFRARFGGERSLAPGDDGESAVFFHDTAWPEELEPGALAQTVLHTDGAGKLRDADIHVNGAAYRFSTDGAAGTQDIRSVLVHEIGHALGLGHSTDARATMNVSGSGLRWRSLEQDDVDGVCALYPGTGSAGCDAEPCPPGLRCVAGACQRPGARADVCSPCTPELGACEAAGDDARCVDVGEGSSAGRVCGRACARDEDCGAGFACRPTTEAGDLQCLSLTGCRNGANTCTSDADCDHPGSTCRAGACVGNPGLSPDAGPSDADAGGPPDELVPEGGGGDCACRSAPAGAAGATTTLALAATAAIAALRRAARRRLE